MVGSAAPDGPAGAGRFWLTWDRAVAPHAATPAEIAQRARPARRRRRTRATRYVFMAGLQRDLVRESAVGSAVSAQAPRNGSLRVGVCPRFTAQSHFSGQVRSLRDRRQGTRNRR
ncbi:hypothetical protein SCOCK_10120 [Actinacidiphila cocklensis]|uniref:Uncharacterized protein n=1 Tax=Actinacidiphila cocklensis TaxID=887465 RepID=A0A9W4DI27_9ACTN|nr:hypothetical protein SCOCK_10120 [Actinacidiphila cocklensis]